MSDLCMLLWGLGDYVLGDYVCEVYMVHQFGKTSLWDVQFLLMCNIFSVLAFIHHFILFYVISHSFIIYCFIYYVS